MGLFCFLGVSHPVRVTIGNKTVAISQRCHNPQNEWQNRKVSSSIPECMFGKCCEINHKNNLDQMITFSLFAYRFTMHQITC